VEVKDLEFALLILSTSLLIGFVFAFLLPSIVCGKSKDSASVAVSSAKKIPLKEKEEPVEEEEDGTETTDEDIEENGDTSLEY
jgi:hypothetical protein